MVWLYWTRRSELHVKVSWFTMPLPELRFPHAVLIHAASTTSSSRSSFASLTTFADQESYIIRNASIIHRIMSRLITASSLY
ncbi:hypothetical protein I3842_15G003400 [Carya illinoinensis]|uniref:Uncharacterized protein n=1 Tax=Carya illinoinensis TaxID=32201 RepID=A0A922A4F1_CARIL|nr:hypothetical protein I3842_Q071600 [Carya illinoinensis]KAG6673685.1 hypothetical protein I3842_15G003400 [Carya illinoinensis]